MKPQTTIRIMRVTFFFIGLGMLVVAMFWLVRQRHFVATASRAHGTVVELERYHSSSSDGDSTTWAPVVTFNTPDGTAHTFVERSSSNPPAYRRGEQVGVFYAADNPGSAVVDGWFSLWGGMSIVGALGVIFTLVGVGLILMGRRGIPRKALLHTGR